MLVIPGAAAANDCDRVTRRELLRVGGSSVLGLSLAQLFALQRATAAEANSKNEGGPGFGKAKSVIFVYLQGGPSHLDLWDPKDNVPDKVKSVFKHQATEAARHARHRTAAEAREGTRQDHAHPLDELHAERPVQPHGRHLPDADRLHDRQGEPVRPAGAAEPEGLPEPRLEHHQVQAADRADAAVRDDAAAAAGVERRRQGRHRRLPGQGATIRTCSTRPATTWT